MWPIHTWSVGVTLIIQTKLQNIRFGKKYFQKFNTSQTGGDLQFAMLLLAIYNHQLILSQMSWMVFDWNFHTIVESIFISLWSLYSVYKMISREIMVLLFKLLMILIDLLIGMHETKQAMTPLWAWVSMTDVSASNYWLDLIRFMLPVMHQCTNII